MLGHLRIQRQQVADHVGRAVGQQVDRTAVPLDRARRQLVARRVGDQPGVRLVTDPQTVLGEECGRVGVVGRDRRLLDVVLGLVAVGVDPTRPALGQQPGLEQAGPDPVLQLGRRLGGERQAEDLARLDLAGRDQPDHAGRHHGGLARAGARDHDRRLQVGGDRRELLLAVEPVMSHQGGELRGGVDIHESTDPDAWAGQIGWNGQRSQCGPGRATNASSRTAATAFCSCASICGGEGACGWIFGWVSPSRSWTSSAPPAVTGRPYSSSAAPLATASW